MKRIGMGLVGAGFVGPHHLDAVRRLGYVDVVAIAGSSEASARKKADALHVPKAYGSVEALLDDPDIQVVHNATPNYLHFPVNMAIDRQGQAHRLRQAPGDDRGGSEAAARRRQQGRHRPRGDLQLSRQPARAAGARSDRPRRGRHADGSCTGTICRTGCCTTPTIRGASSPTRAARHRRSATSARTGATWRSMSAG